MTHSHELPIGKPVCAISDMTGFKVLNKHIDTRDMTHPYLTHLPVPPRIDQDGPGFKNLRQRIKEHERHKEVNVTDCIICILII